MSPRTMTEPEAWREIARRIVEGEWSRFGLCREVAGLQVQRKITEEKASAMAINVLSHLMETSSRRHGYVYPEGAEPDSRALAALWLALEAEEEGA
jgi:hypothetical protein